MFVAQNDIKKRIGIFLTVLGTIILLCALGLNFLLNNERNISKQLNQIDKSLEKSKDEFSKLAANSELINKLILGQETLDDIVSIKKNHFSFFLYKEDEAGNNEYLRYWNSNYILPDSVLKSKNQINGIYHLDNGYYYVQKKPLSYNQSIYAYAFTLIKYDFAVQTEYISNTFFINSYLHKYVTISDVPTKLMIHVPSGTGKLYVKFIDNSKISIVDNTVILLKVLGLFLLLFGLFSILVAKLSLNEVQEVVGLGIFFLSLRIGYQLLDYKIQFTQFYISQFQFTYFNTIVSNLGWLMMDIIFIFIFSLATYNIVNARVVKKDITEVKQLKNKKYIGINKFLLSFIYVSITFLMIELVKNLILNSKISFDITNFESLTIGTIVGFVLIAFIVFNYYILSRICFKILYNYLHAFSGELIIYILISNVLWLTFFSKSEYFLFYSISVSYVVLFFIAVHVEKKAKYKFKFNISRKVFWVCFFSIFTALCVVYFVNKNEIQIRKNYAVSKLKQPDFKNLKAIQSVTDTLNIQKIKKGYATNGDAYFENMIQNINKNASGLIHEIIIFDSSRHAIFNKNNVSYETLTELRKRHAQISSPENVTIYKATDNATSYINYQTLEDSSSRDFVSFYVISSPLNKSIQLIAHELFLKLRNKEMFNSALYQYAVYKQNTLVSSNSDFPFALSIDPSKYPTQLFQEEQIEGYSLLWYRPNYTDLLVIVRSTHLFIQTLTIFSYFFCIFFLIILLVDVLPFIYNLFLQDRKRIIPLFAQTIRKQVYSTFIILSIIIFVVISIATVQFYISAFEEYNNDRIKRVLNTLNQDIQSLNFKEVNNSRFFVGDNQKKLESEVAKLANAHDLDMNIYDVTGRLVATSQVEFYNKGFVSKQINDVAFYNLLRLKKVVFTQKEQISNLDFSNIYKPILDKNDKLMGYISIPHFSMNRELGQKIVEVLITLLNIYTFIFLVTSLISLFITDRITRSLAIVGAKMQEIDFLKESVPIEWHRKDEIGKLVDEYNKMLIKLKESMGALAVAEREVAWREMAKQVAHEIKNPLTPMKLNLQYLQRAIKNNQPGITEIINQVSHSLVEQIDHLSNIASEFLEFANISKSKKEKINLHECLTLLKNIYSIQPNVVFDWIPLNENIFIIGDKTHINRLFTNLIVNAIEASEGDKAYVSIHEYVEQDDIKIIVADKGKGITPEIAKYLFTPNFTTKSSGTGLGLAMCKGIVEQMKGKIWLNQESESDTQICIKLPIYKFI